MTATHSTNWGNLKLEYFKDDDSLAVNGRRIPSNRMQEIANEERGANRIHKPIALLFWTDCRNGESSNWGA